MLQATSLILLSVCTPVFATEIRVPDDYRTIQGAIDAAKPGDIILVDAGTYKERIQLKPQVVVRSAGDDSIGKLGLKRAETTIIDGGGKSDKKFGVQMAEGSELDGFTITNVGNYNEEIWTTHFQSNGEELGDDEGSVQAEGTAPAISIRSVNCRVRNNIVHHNGDVGIAVIGKKGQSITPLIHNNFSYKNLGGGIGVADFAEPIVQKNVCSQNLRAGIGCRNANPFIVDNTCFQNIRAGIGCREGARPIIRDNRCYQNRRAGIGIRMQATSPIVEGNQCYQNEMAGIGCRDGAEPIIRNNNCYENKLAGIGSDGAKPLITTNVCRKNLAAGIGIRGNSDVTILNNKCIENKRVAIGVTQASTAIIIGNTMLRRKGVPPIIAVKDQSTAMIKDNDIHGGGVAAVLIQGKATISENRFHGAGEGAGEKQGNAIWVWKGSKATIDNNKFVGYASAINASGSELIVTDNTIRQFRGAGIVIKDSFKPAHVHGNIAFSNHENEEAFDIKGKTGVVAENVTKKED